MNNELTGKWPNGRQPMEQELQSWNELIPRVWTTQELYEKIVLAWARYRGLVGDQAYRARNNIMKAEKMLKTKQGAEKQSDEQV